MAKKLREKAAMIGAQKLPGEALHAEPSSLDQSQQTAVEAATAGASPRAARTAPGVMFDFMAAQSGAIKETSELRGKLAEFEGAGVVRKVDPKTVRMSRWANRHPTSFLESEFAALKAEIESSGGNVQAIKVRPITPTDKPGGPSPTHGTWPSGGPSPTGESVAAEYEIVFGHRRHRACLELGLPVLTLIEALSDQQLFAEMDRENRDRKDLSAWEQGSMYARALDAGLYPSNRKLAESIGRDHSDINRALSLARLPPPIVDAFKSPLDLQFRWAKPLSDAQQKDPEALIARAKALKSIAAKMSAKEIFERLVGADTEKKGSQSVPDIIVKSGKKLMAVISADEKGRTHVRFDVTMDATRRRDLAKILEKFVDNPGTGG